MGTMEKSKIFSAIVWKQMTLKPSATVHPQVHLTFAMSHVFC